MVQLNTTSKPALGKQAQLRNEKFVDLQCVVNHKCSKYVKGLTCFFRDQLHFQDLELGKDEDVQKCREGERLCCSVNYRVHTVYSYVHLHKASIRLT